MQNNPKDSHIDRLPEHQQANYLQALQLYSAPFSSQTKLETPYSNEDREQYLNHLLHIVQSSDLIQVVVGERGSGKSTLLQTFIQLSGPSLRCCTIQATNHLEESELLQVLAVCLDLPENQSNPALLELLWEESFNLQRKDLTPVILVDNAHLLPDKTLSLLLQLQSVNATDTSDNSSPWRTILFTEAEHTVALLELDTRLHFIELEGLTEKQTADYLEHRLKASGMQQPSPFSPKDIAFIHKIANGNLNKTNELAHQVLLDKYAKQQPKDSKIMTQPLKVSENKYMNLYLKNKTVVIALAAVALLLIILLLFQDNINKLVEPQRAENNREVIAMPQPKDFEMPRIPEPVAAEDVSSAVSEPAPVQSTPTPTESEAVSDATVTPTNITGTEKTAALDAQSTPIENDSTTTAAKPQEPEAIEPPTAATAPVPVNPEPAPTTDSLTSQLEKAGIKSREWILQQPASHFSAQLMGSSQVDTLIKVASQNALKDNAAIYKLLRDNKDWFVLIFGSEPSKSAMQKAVSALPASLQRNKPWVRAMTTIQAEVKSGKK